jgi:GNAT superfamily N-acetyltransferase
MGRAGFDAIIAERNGRAFHRCDADCHATHCRHHRFGYDVSLAPASLTRMTNRTDSRDSLVRPVARDDFARWKPLWDAYNAFYGRAGPTALPDDVTQATWARFFDAYEPMHAFVAERDGSLLGLVHFLFHRTTNQIAPTCYLQDLYTASDARGQGIGRALIEAVYGRAAEAGIPRVYWHTHETNQVAMCLYDQVAEKSGFVVYRRTL